MADYKELLRRAVEALPENNGAARRAVYEKARAALVGQLRAINPPLAARDITAHRMQLEDCIRQVEQEASEAVIAGLGGTQQGSLPPPPVYFEPPARKALPAATLRNSGKATPAATGRETPRPLPAGGSIEEIIAAANSEPTDPPAENRPRAVARPDAKPIGKPVPKLVPSTRQQPPPPPDDSGDDESEPDFTVPPKPADKPVGRPVPSIVARAEASKSRTSSTAFGVPVEKPYDSNTRRGPSIEPRRDGMGPRLEPAARGGQQALARQSQSQPLVLFNSPPVAAAMSAVREVEVEPQPVDPQGAIDRAIATLDREARGDVPDVNGFDYDPPEDEEIVFPEPRKNGTTGMFAGKVQAEAPLFARPVKPAKPTAAVRDKRAAKGRDSIEGAFPRARAEDERRGISAISIFLIVFAVLLVGVGGAAFWAWREGFIDLDAMFGRAPALQQQAVVTPVPGNGDALTPATGPGNTETPADNAAPAPELRQEERLVAEPVAAETQALPLVDPGKTEERLGAANAAADNAETAVASIDPANLAGSQSLLLEASDDGKTGAVPFSGTVDWSKGTDEFGLPTLVGTASIPARNLGVDVLIRKNSDPSLPASHLMEINFRVSDSFIGGSVAGLPGVLLKNEELVQGAPLVGASARVVGNSFLFALSASPEDVTANNNLFTSRKWIDLAVIYATGKRAIITLEKDSAAETMFTEVFAAWSKTASN